MKHELKTLKKIARHMIMMMLLNVDVYKRKKNLKRSIIKKMYFHTRREFTGNQKDDEVKMLHDVYIIY